MWGLRLKMTLVVLCVCGALGASEAVPAETTLRITEAWAHESPPTATNGAAYMTVSNWGQVPDRLVEISSTVSVVVELHTHVPEGNMMKMRRLDAMEILPGTPAVLQPGGVHIMLIGLKQPLVAGQTFPLRLRFERAGEITVEVSIRKYGERHQ